MDTPRVKIVDSVQSQSSSTDRWNAIAMMYASTPVVAWYALFTLVGGFLLLAIFYNYHNLEDFTSLALLWIGRGLIAIGVVIGIFAAYKMYQIYHVIHLQIYERRQARLTTEKTRESVRKLQIQNQQLEIRLEIDRQLPLAMKYAMDQGFNFKYDGKTFEVLSPMSNLHALNGPANQAQIEAPAGAPLPTYVRYEDIRHEIPSDRVLIGIGPNGIETKGEDLGGACVWVVGQSGTGKTSTVVVRVEERYSKGHKFLGYDPHFHKPDSLWNAISGYAGSFLQPMARYSHEGLTAIQSFLEEFKGRKSGRILQPWQKITIIIDEVNSLIDKNMFEDETDEEIAKLLPTLARICGTESRNFNMGGIFISQTATYLAWLRKYALLQIVHQMNQPNEIELATGDRNIAKEMRSWPIGRTFVWGINFGEEPHTVQQPYFEKPQNAVGWEYPGEYHPQPSTVDADNQQNEEVTPEKSVLKFVPKQSKRATLADAIAVCKEYNTVLRSPTLMKELQKRGFECSDFLARRFVEAIEGQMQEEM